MVFAPSRTQEVYRKLEGIGDQRIKFTVLKIFVIQHFVARWNLQLGSDLFNDANKSRLFVELCLASPEYLQAVLVISFTMICILN